MTLPHVRLHAPRLAFALCAMAFLAQAVSAQPKEEATPDTAQVADERLVAEALAVPPGDLGMAYLVNKTLSEFAGTAQGNIRIITPEGTIDEKNAKKRQREFQARQLAYRAAILQRGFETLGGTYAIASVAKSCGRSGSTLLAGAAEGMFSEVEIDQVGFEVVLSLSFDAGDGRDLTFDMNGVVVESSVVVSDPLNSEYFLEGRTSGDNIELKPRLEVLQGWPSWASPPKKSDLQQCSLVLRELEGGG